MQPKFNASEASTEAAVTPPASSKSDRRKRNIPVATDRRHRSPSPDVSGAEAAPIERRQRDIPAAVDSRKHEQAPEPVPEHGSDEAAAFKIAMDRYKRENRRPFPTWSEVLEVLRSLGYRKVEEESALPAQQKDLGMPPPKG